MQLHKRNPDRKLKQLVYIQCSHLFIFGRKQRVQNSNRRERSRTLISSSSVTLNLWTSQAIFGLRLVIEDNTYEVLNDKHEQ